MPFFVGREIRKKKARRKRKKETPRKHPERARGRSSEQVEVKLLNRPRLKAQGAATYERRLLGETVLSDVPPPTAR